MPDLRRAPMALTRAVRDTSRFARLTPGSVAYLGFDGYSNVGDDAIRFVWDAALPDANIVSVRQGRSVDLALKLSGAVRGRFRPMFRGVVMGGGTLVGRFGWRERVEAALATGSSLRGFTLGVGVEDPTYEHAAELTSVAELERWAQLLRSRFDRVTTRGPDSARTLAEFGISAEVVGDPALLIQGAQAPTEHGRIGINLASTENRWGGEADRVVRQVAQFAGMMKRAGWSIQPIPMWRGDRSVMKHFADLVEDGVEQWNPSLSVDSVLGAIQRCDIVVGERLHAAVLASALSVPSISLEYRPKCRDFQRSLKRESFVVRSDRLQGGDLYEMATHISANRATHLAHLNESVAILRSRLIRELEVVRKGLGLPGEPPPMQPSPLSESTADREGR